MNVDNRLLDLTYVIYKFTNLINGKIYIGQTTKRFGRRLLNHEVHARNGYHSHLYNSIRKHGWDNFKIEIIDHADTKEELDDKEIYWISYYRSFIGFDDCNGYNQTLGGEGSLGRITTKETKLKISKKITGMFIGERNVWYGKTGKDHPAFGRDNKWGNHTEETKLRISNSLKGENNVNFGKRGKDNHNSIPIVQLDESGKLIAEHSSLTDGAVAVDGLVQSIVKCLKGVTKSSYGFQWMYKKDYEKIKYDLINKTPKTKVGQGANLAVVQLTMDGDFIAEYHTISEGSRSVGLKSMSSVAECCKGKRKSAKGYKWMYKKDYIEKQELAGV